jgi:hypothetical protein
MVWAIENVLTVLAVAINFFSILRRAFTAITPTFSRLRHSSIKGIAQFHRLSCSLTYYSLDFTVHLRTMHLVKTLRRTRFTILDRHWLKQIYFPIAILPTLVYDYISHINYCIPT